MFNKKVLIAIIVIILLSYSVSAVFRTQIYDYSGKDQRKMVNFSEIDATNISSDLFIGNASGLFGLNKSGFIDIYTSGNFNGSLYTVPGFLNSSASSSRSLFQVVSDTRGTPQFQVQNGGPFLASFITRSFIVVNQNNSLLNSSMNNDCRSWGFKDIDCNTATTGADFGVTDDIEAINLIHAGVGLKSGAGAQGAYLELSDDIEKYSGTSGVYNATTQFFCDYVTNNFEDTGGWIHLIAEGTDAEGALADIATYINTSCVTVKNNPAWMDITIPIAWDVEEEPIFAVVKGGFAEFYVGSHEEAEFKIRGKNSTGDHSFHVDVNAGDDNHISFAADIDTRDYTGVGAISSLVYSSTGATNIHSDLDEMTIDTTNINNSEFHILDINHLGNGANNIFDAIHIHGIVDDIIQTGSSDIANAVYDNELNVTVNATTTEGTVTVFETNLDFLYIGSTTNFTTISLSLDTGSSHDLNFNYFYCNTTGDWELLPGVVDSTAGFKSSGSIDFPNPDDRGLCSKEFDGTPFDTATNYSYIAILRTKVNILTPPVINSISVGGASTGFILREDYMKLIPISSAPEICSVSSEGGIYYNDIDNKHYGCDGATWIAFY